MQRSLIFALLLLFLVPVIALAGSDVSCPVEAGKPIKVFAQTDIDAGGTYTMTADTVWHLYGRVHVKAGQTLYVEPGTIIKGDKPGETLHPDEPSAIIVDRDGYAEMIGTEDAPIIMTVVDDNVNDPYDIAHGTRGEWGGLIVLGRANIGACPAPCVEGTPERRVEGIPDTDWDYDLVVYGCDDTPGNLCDDEDNSGIYQYISIRHGGYEIGEANEINGMTMGALGSGTTIDHIEVYCNLDDGFEWFGGTVNTRYLVSAFEGDDSFDYDQGFRGYGQFWFSVQDDAADKSGEHDGNEDPEDACPYARPDIANVTYIGPGLNSTGAASSRFFTIRDNAGGHYYNSIFIDHPGSHATFESTGATTHDPFNYPNECDCDAEGEDTEMRAACGDLTFDGTFWYNLGSGASTPTFVYDYLFNVSAWGNNVDGTDVELNSYPPTVDPAGLGSDFRALASFGLDARPAATSPVLVDNGYTPVDLPTAIDTDPCVLCGGAGGPDDLAAPAWFDDVDYAGAFAPDVKMWTDCWTFLDFGGYTGYPKVTEVFDQDDMDATGTYTLTADKEWLLYGRVHVKAGQTLYVEPGTVIKGDKPGESLHPDEPSALIIDRDGYAEMIGTEDAPIIMTVVDDNVNDPYDIAHGTRGEWGGLIVLGRANIGACPAPCVEGTPERRVEGIPDTDWDYDLVVYGCDDTPGNLCDDEDNSGIYQYISIRHGGYEIGEANEINGMTMGALGSGTTIDHIEVYCNLDDGFEWFGGTVNTRYLVSAFEGDDSFDYDQGFRGYGQFWFSVQDDAADKSGEHDGNEDPEDACPYARPDIANVTYIGPGLNSTGAASSRFFTIRDNAGGHYYNSIFIDHPGGYASFESTGSTIHDPGDCQCDPEGEDTEMRAACGDLTFSGSFWYNIGDPASTDAFVTNYLFTEWDNYTIDPELCSYPPTVGRPGAMAFRDLATGTLNPRPVPGGAAATADADGRLDPMTGDVDTDPCVLCGGGVSCDIGNADGLGIIDIDDVVYMIQYLYAGGPAPVEHECCANVDGLGIVDIDDVVYLIQYLYAGGPAPDATACDGVGGGGGPDDLDPPAWWTYVPYPGAFDPDAESLWTDKWTFLHFGGYTCCCDCSPAGE